MEFLSKLEGFFIIYNMPVITIAPDTQDAMNIKLIAQCM